nr:putative pentatricopeptide repeat-containing protein At1g12700, mitochondrial [Tanacetum cinerariifolium]
MHAKGQMPSQLTYVIILEGLCTNHQIEEALSLFHLMGDSKLISDVVVYSILIDGASKCGKFDIAKGLFLDLINRGMHPNIQTYNVMISGLCREGLVGDEKQLFLKIGESGCRSNNVTYRVLLQGYLKNNHYDDVEMFVQEMDGRGLDVVEMHAKGQMPSQLTYVIILEGLCTNHQIEEALSLFHLMGDSKLISDVVVYSILIDGASKCGKFDIAKGLFLDLINRGMHPNIQTYNVMISGLCREGLVGDEKQLFLKIGESGCRSNNVTYRVLLQGYLKNNHYDDVEMFVQEMDGRGYSLDATTLSLLLDQIAGGSLNNTLPDSIGNQHQKFESHVVSHLTVSFNESKTVTFLGRKGNNVSRSIPHGHGYNKWEGVINPKNKTHSEKQDSLRRTRLTPPSLEICMCLKDHLDAKERKQDKWPLEIPLDFEKDVFGDEVQRNEAIPLSDEEIALDASSEGTLSPEGLRYDYMMSSEAGDDR